MFLNLKIAMDRISNVLTKPRNSSRMLYLLVPFLIFFYSLVAIEAWYLGEIKIVSIRDHWVAMTPVTSLAFLVSSVAMIFHAYNNASYRDHFTGAVNAIVLMALAAFSFNRSGLNIFPAIENPLFVEKFILSSPSLATVFMFVVFSASFFLKNRIVPSLIICIISLFVLLFGYFLNNPWGTFYFDGHSTGVAFTTAVMFLHIGLWLYPWKKNHNNG